MSKDPKFETISNDQKRQKECRVTSGERISAPRHPTLDPRFFWDFDIRILIERDVLGNSLLI